MITPSIQNQRKNQIPSKYTDDNQNVRPNGLAARVGSPWAFGRVVVFGAEAVLGLTGVDFLTEVGCLGAEAAVSVGFFLIAPGLGVT